MFAKTPATVSKPPTVLRPSAVPAGVNPTQSSFELGGCNLASSPSKKRAKVGGSKKGWVHKEITCIPGGNKAKCNHCVGTLNTTTNIQQLSVCVFHSTCSQPRA